MRLLVIITFLIAPCGLQAQHAQLAPRVGDVLPDFILTDVQHYKKSTVTRETFKGKWLMLYFWSLGCVSSVGALDKANEIQNRFDDYLQVVSIGYVHKPKDKEDIVKVFERKRRTHNYTLPIAYDTVLYEAWDIIGVPAFFIVDPEGVLRYVVPGGDLTMDKVARILAGETVQLRSLYFDFTNTSGRMMFAETVKDEDLEYASVLTKWHGELPRIGHEFDLFVGLSDEYKERGWSVAFATLTRLYQYAYYGQAWITANDTASYGKIFERPILEVSDKTPFEVQDFATGRGYYNYYLKLPLKDISKKRMMSEMQELLQKMFGYKAAIETRTMPIWRLEVDSDAVERLRSKGGDPKSFGKRSVAGVHVQNFLIKDFLRMVTANLPNERRLPFLDFTGITFRVDAKVETDMTDFESVQRALNRYGLKLKPSSKEMKVLVIRDP